MVRLNELNSELSKVDRLSVTHDLSLGTAQQIMLFEFILNNSHGQLRRIERKIQFLQYVWKSTDMVLMSMGDHEALHFVNIIF